MMVPIKIEYQNTINKRGEIIGSKQLTHNQIKVFKSSGILVNIRVRKDDLHNCMYGHCLLYVIHFVVSCRARHTDKRILLQNLEYKSAYHRSHFNWNTAIQKIAQEVTS